MMSFEQLISEALQTPFQGWDFSYLAGRQTEFVLPWDYTGKVREKIPAAQSMLDLGTGGGEILSSLTPLPPNSYATESYAPNVALAREKLAPLGGEVVDTTSDQENRHLPFPDSYFDLVINRHECYVAKEVGRLLKPGGCFITQQCGCSGLKDFIEFFKGPTQPGDWTAATAARAIREAGFRVIDQQESFPEYSFLDIGAVVYFLRAIPWILGDFTVEKYISQLRAMHEHIGEFGGFPVKEHRFLIEAIKCL
jgi:SAM-dependent methyltransferase